MLLSKPPGISEATTPMTPWLPGNRWAGGSGGADTAGLGGRGGPYRSGRLGFQPDGWIRT